MEKSKKMNMKEQEFIKDKDFIIFGEDYGRHPHALEHILRPLFETNQFIWVETIGLRTPKFSVYDILRILEKLKKWILTSSQKNKIFNPPKNVKILSPFMIPFAHIKPIRHFNQWNVHRVIKKELRIRNISKPIAIASVPNACDFIGSFNEILKIYFCVDEFSLWPGLNQELVKTFETKLIHQSDLIIATSD